MKNLKSVVKLRHKIIKNGTKSLYLDIWHEGKRKYKFLKLYIVEPKNQLDRNLNRENLLLAESIRSKTQLAIKNKQYGFKADYRMEDNFIEYFKKLTEERYESHNNYGNWDAVHKHLIAYAGLVVPFNDADVEFVRGFKEYLKYKCKTKSNKPLSSNSQYSYFNKFRAAFNQAHRDGIIPINPIVQVKGIKAETPQREYLTIDEIRKLVKTDCRYPMLKSAFLFSCLTGLRWSDANKLLWKDVFKEEHCYRIKFRQQKTGGLEYLDINNQAYELMGEKGLKDDRVFIGLRYSAYMNVELSKWVMRAGIQKDITFHSSRHTFAVMQLEMGTEV
jgi:integrase